MIEPGAVGRPSPSSASRQPCGPAPQLTPIDVDVGRVERRRRRRRASCRPAARAPRRRSASATIGRSAAAGAPPRSRSAGGRATRTSRTGTGRRRPRAGRRSASRKAARTVASPQMQRGRGSGAPSGPMEPATSTSRPATSRASRASWAPRRVEPAGLVGEAVRREPDPVGAERRGLDQVRAGGEVLAVDGADQVRPRLDELVEARPAAGSRARRAACPSPRRPAADRAARRSRKRARASTPER